jgi:predicted alpha/beta hydrolase family esterase
MLRLRFRSIVVASSNDPYVTLFRAQTFAMAWGSEFVMIGEAGHINSASGLGDWAEGFALLNALRKTPRRKSQRNHGQKNKYQKEQVMEAHLDPIPG